MLQHSKRYFTDKFENQVFTRHKKFSSTWHKARHSLSFSCEGHLFSHFASAIDKKSFSLKVSAAALISVIAHMFFKYRWYKNCNSVITDTTKSQQLSRHTIFENHWRNNQSKSQNKSSEVIPRMLKQFGISVYDVHSRISSPWLWQLHGRHNHEVGCALKAFNKLAELLTEGPV